MPRHAPGTLRRARRIARLGGALVGLLAGVFYGFYIIPNSQGVFDSRTSVALATLLACGAVGMASGFLLGPALSVEPYVWLERTLDEASLPEMIGAVTGLVVALVIGTLLTLLLSGLPAGVGYMLALVCTGALVHVGVGVGRRRRVDLAALLSAGAGRSVRAAGEDGAEESGGPPGDGEVVVDTSVLIDGRILDVARTGFLPRRLIVPGFVLEEVQRVADAADPVRRAKGRRGLAVVDSLQKSADVQCRFVDTDYAAIADVDIRLVKLARSTGAAIMTNDYNLNRLAQVEDVRVLNLNDLALALRPMVSAGETMSVTVVKEGKEPHQGVGYLDDGTMVVIENGRDHLDEVVNATVTSVLQTPAGRMIFASLPADDRRQGRQHRDRVRVSRVVPR